MPAVKKYPFEQRKARVQACIGRYMKLNDVQVEVMAKRMNVAESTLYRWISNPGKMQLEDIWRMATILKCPIGELAGGELPEELIGEWIAKAAK